MCLYLLLFCLSLFAIVDSYRVESRHTSVTATAKIAVIYSHQSSQSGGVCVCRCVWFIVISVAYPSSSSSPSSSPAISVHRLGFAIRYLQHPTTTTTTTNITTTSSVCIFLESRLHARIFNTTNSTTINTINKTSKVYGRLQKHSEGIGQLCTALYL